jgi:hypothetical protein
MLGFYGADGQLPAAKATLYTAGGNEVLLGITLVATAAATVKLYVNRTGTSRPILWSRALVANETLEFPLGSGRHHLESGDLIEGEATVAATVHYIVSLIRRS